MPESTEFEPAAVAESDDVIVALRTAQQHQVQLNVLADQKANINIGFTLFFVTLTQSQLSLAGGQSAIMRVGFVLLILSSATSLLLALIVVLPPSARRPRLAPTARRWATAREASNESANSSLASSWRPWLLYRLARLFIELSVAGWSLPSTRSRASSEAT